MAEAFLRSLNPGLEVFSAGTNPVGRVHPKAIEVMREIGIGLEEAYPKNVDDFISQSFDYVITVCDHAREVCPVFAGNVTHRIHMGFDDPAEATGSEDEIMAVFRRVRDEIKEGFFQWYSSVRSSETNPGQTTNQMSE